MKQEIFDKVINTGIMLSAEKDYDKLLSMIIDSAMEITNCDGGTLYLFNDKKLEFCITKNKSMNINETSNDEHLFPPVEMSESNVCSYCAIHRKFLNIADVYECSLFDFNGPAKYDNMSSYRTKSMLVYPLINNENELIGVVQLINALDEESNIITFDKEYEIVMKSLGSQAAIAVSNMKYVEEIEDLMMSITKTFTDAIDTTIPYNYFHSRNVCAYMHMCINYINTEYKLGNTKRFYDNFTKKELLMASLMHDIGKIVVPSDIINKTTKLGKNEKHVLDRLDNILAYYHIDYLEKKIDQSEWIDKKNYILDAKEKIVEINNKSFITEKEFDYIKDLSNKCYTYFDGRKVFYLTEEESQQLQVKKGNLTQNEREIICSHVTYTEKYLKKMNFEKRYPDIIKWAGSHHEFLDGSGYPRGIKAKDISFESRLLTSVDIFEALISSDRPYKKSIKENKAFEILWQMVNEGKIDKETVEILENAVKNNNQKIDTYYNFDN